MFFKSPILQDLVKKIKNETNGDEHCLISRLAVQKNNAVYLPCNHVYHVDFFNSLVKKKQICPYCRQGFDLALIQKRCQECGKITFIQNGLCKLHNINRCEFILVKGKRRGNLCDQKACYNSNYCKRHDQKS